MSNAYAARIPISVPGGGTESRLRVHQGLTGGRPAVCSADSRKVLFRSLKADWPEYTGGTTLLQFTDRHIVTSSQMAVVMLVMWCSSLVPFSFKPLLYCYHQIRCSTKNEHLRQFNLEINFEAKFYLCLERSLENPACPCWQPICLYNDRKICYTLPVSRRLDQCFTHLVIVQYWLVWTTSFVVEY